MSIEKSRWIQIHSTCQSPLSILMIFLIFLLQKKVGERILTDMEISKLLKHLLSLYCFLWITDKINWKNIAVTKFPKRHYYKINTSQSHGFVSVEKLELFLKSFYIDNLSNKLLQFGWYNNLLLYIFHHAISKN